MTYITTLDVLSDDTIIILLMLIVLIGMALTR
jgi:hypothetical protein